MSSAPSCTDPAVSKASNYYTATRTDRSPEIYYNLGSALIDLGRKQEAFEPIEKAVSAQPRFGDAYKHYADLLYERGNSSAAVEQYRRSLQFAPDRPVVMNTLAWILATGDHPSPGQAAEAVDLAERACRLTDHRQYALMDTLGAAYAAAGRFPEAVETAAKALELAEASGQRAFLPAMRLHLELYRAGRRYCESAASRPGSRDSP